MVPPTPREVAALEALSLAAARQALTRYLPAARLPRPLSGLSIAQITDLHIGRTIGEEEVRRWEEEERRREAEAWRREEEERRREEEERRWEEEERRWEEEELQREAEARRREERERRREEERRM